MNLRLMRASWFAFSEVYVSFLSISSAVLMFMGCSFRCGLFVMYYTIL